MGIHIRLNILPDKISKNDWNSVYQEAKQLINAYPFLDIISDEDTYSCSWHYADSPSQKPIKCCKNNIGFRMSGDLITMQTAESFELIKDLNYYRSDSKPKEEYIDILQLYTDDLHASAKVFDDKTQGYDYHSYILAIGCLIEDRLKPYALVHGDISRGQMEMAIEWANGILKKPVHLSELADNESLLARIRKFASGELAALRLFMETTQNEKDYQLGCFIRNNISQASIIKYYTEEISERKIGTFGFSNILTEYLNLGNDPAVLCDICVDKDSDADTIALFIKTIFKLGVHLKPENSARSEQRQLEQLSRLEADNPHSKTPDTVGSMFGKFFSIMSLGNVRQSNMYVPVEKLVEIFKEKFGVHLDVDAEVSKYIDKKREDTYEGASVKTLTDNQDIEIIERYDIEDLDNLILWEPGMTILPQLEEFIVNVKDFVEGDIPEVLEALLKKLKKANKKERMEYLITYNKHFLISKRNWDYIEENIDDFSFFSKIMRILLIDASEIKINRLALSLLNNNRLLEKYILNNQGICEKSNAI